MRRKRSRALRGPLLVASILAIAALLLSRSTLGAPQAAKSGAPARLPPVESLQLQHTTVFSAPAPLGYSSGIRCDSHGHAYLLPATFAGVPPRLQPFSSVAELIPDEKQIMTYRTLPLSVSRYPHAAMLSFAVLPDGRLYALIATRQFTSKGKPRSEPQYYVERFNNDRTRDSITHIQTPPGVAHWYAALLAPFSDGRFLIAGTSTNTKERPDAGSWRPFTAIYDSSGGFVGDVTMPHDIPNNFNEGGAGKPRAAGKAKGKASPAQASKPGRYFDVAITTGGAVSGPYGNVWILRNSNPIRLYAVDSSGRVTQHFGFSPPVPGLVPLDFGFASPGEIFFEFARPPAPPGAPSKGPSELVGVFNTTLQQFEALYTLPEKDNKFLRPLACSDGNGGFLYLGSTRDNHLGVFDYAPQ
jgi:hypothetical protein